MVAQQLEHNRGFERQVGLYPRLPQVDRGGDTSLSQLDHECRVTAQIERPRTGDDQGCQLQQARPVLSPRGHFRRTDEILPLSFDSRVILGSGRGVPVGIGERRLDQCRLGCGQGIAEYIPAEVAHQLVQRRTVLQACDERAADEGAQVLLTGGLVQTADQRQEREAGRRGGADRQAGQDESSIAVQGLPGDLQGRADTVFAALVGIAQVEARARVTQACGEGCRRRTLLGHQAGGDRQGQRVVAQQRGDTGDRSIVTGRQPGAIAEEPRRRVASMVWLQREEFEGVVGHGAAGRPVLTGEQHR